MRGLFIFLVLCTYLFYWCQGYNILCVLPTPSRSHNILGKGIVDSLLNAGHTVTWVTSYPPKEKDNERLKIVDSSATAKILQGFDKMVIDKKLNAFNGGLSMLMNNVRKISKTALTPELQKLVVEKQYDAVVTEFFFNEVDSGYAAIQQKPWIVLSGSTLQPMLQSLVDEARTVPTLPMIFTDFPVPMNFWQRLVTTGMFLGMNLGNWWNAKINSVQYTEMFAPLAAKRGVPLPSYEDAVKNISIVFVNSHPSIGPPISLSPNVIDVAGFHIDENVPALPKDLQDLLDSSTQGFIYFSMGSVIQSKNFAEETRRKVLAMFSKLPYTVLWKFEDEMTGLPKNVHVKKWMPQSSILAHKNIKAFITHGGMLSNLEALTHGVPLVAVPMIGDQTANAQRAVRLGYAVKITFEADTLADELKQGLDTILGNDTYYNRAKELSSLFRDRPVPPAKLISHYVEVAIKTKGAYHLRSKAPLYAWYQRAMLDQAVFVVVVLTALYHILKTLVKFVLCKVLGKNKKVKTN